MLIEAMERQCILQVQRERKSSVKNNYLPYDDKADLIDVSDDDDYNFVTYLILRNNPKCDLTVHDVDKVYSFYGFQLNNIEYYYCNMLLNCSAVRFNGSCIKSTVWGIDNTELYKYNVRLIYDTRGKCVMKSWTSEYVLDILGLFRQ